MKTNCVIYENELRQIVVPLYTGIKLAVKEIDNQTNTYTHSHCD